MVLEQELGERFCEVLITHPDFEEAGGVSNYYSKLRGKFTVPVQYFAVGKSPKEKGFWARPLRMLADYWRFVRLLRKNSIDLVHLNPSLDFKSFIRDGIFALLARANKKKIVVFFHGWKKSCEVRIERYFLWLFKSFFGKIDTFIVLSNEVKETLEKWCVVQPIYKEVTVINEDEFVGFDIQNALKKRQESAKWRVLFLARVIREKGIYETLEAVSKVQSKHPAVELVVAGDGEELDNAKSFVRTHKIRNIVFTGYITGAEKRRIFEEANIFCLPSYSEGCPVSVIEAMAYSLPVVTRPVGGLADFFENGKHGFISDSLEPKIFANFIEKLFLDRKLCEEISLYNYQYAQSHFLASDAVSRLERIYKAVLGT
jgi:glycosyltransferase involved in cell wall biosynthesis